MTATDQPSDEPTQAELTIYEQLAADLKSQGLYAKIAWVQQHVGAVQKTGEVKFGNTRFKHMQEHGLIGVLRALWRIAGLVVIPGQMTADAYSKSGNSAIITIGLTVADVDSGEEITRFYTNEGVDNQDKAFNKAYTGATKYALQKFFLVPTQDIDDNETLDIDNTRGAAQPKSGPPVVTPSPDQTAQLRTTIVEAKIAPNKVTTKLTAEFGVSTLDGLTLDQHNAMKQWVEDQIAAGQG